MKKVLIVYDSMMTGGTTTTLLSLLNKIDYSQYSVDLLLFTISGAFLGDIPERVNLLEAAYDDTGKLLSVSREKILRTILNGNAIRACISYSRYKATPKGNLRNILTHYGMRAQVAMSRKIEQEYDVAIGFIEGWADHYVLSGKLSAKKRIVWIHPDYKSSYLVPEIDRKLLNMASYVVTVSQTCCEHFCEIFPEFRNKTVTIENISSLNFIRNRSEADTPTIKKAEVNFCTVARCDMDVKGVDRILSAISKLKNEGYYNFLWHYIGDGRDYELLKRRIDKFDLRDFIVCYGQKNNPLVYLKQMDAFVLASRYEGKPVSVVEALALKVPCIVTEYASAREQIISGKNGLIVENTDEGIYKGLKLYLTSKEIQKELVDGVELESYTNSENGLTEFYNMIRGK